MTVKLYQWENLQAVDTWETKRGFSLEECGRYGFVDCDNGADFVLPEGYEVAETVFGETAIYDEAGKHCYIAYSQGRPLLSSTTRNVTLSPVVQ